MSFLEGRGVVCVLFLGRRGVCVFFLCVSCLGETWCVCCFLVCVLFLGRVVWGLFLRRGVLWLGACGVLWFGVRGVCVFFREVVCMVCVLGVVCVNGRHWAPAAVSGCQWVPAGASPR